MPSILLAEIEKLATGSERTRTCVMVRALKYHLAREAVGGVCLSVLRGREEASAGGGKDADDVLAELEEIIRSRKAA
ncbi:putative transcriptional regulator [Devosia sp. UYZn731]|uniref:CopG family transcriptional regulator n=1 Tax=Devosia sp. UYZn731 TaxID=3156345 RepID=UPI003393EB80